MGIERTSDLHRAFEEGNEAPAGMPDRFHARPDRDGLGRLLVNRVLELCRGKTGKDANKVLDQNR